MCSSTSAPSSAPAARAQRRPEAFVRDRRRQAHRQVLGGESERRLTFEPVKTFLTEAPATTPGLFVYGRRVAKQGRSHGAAAETRTTFLGLDIGTSSVKALLIDADQRAVAEASAALDVSRPHPLWSEQNPDRLGRRRRSGRRRRCAAVRRRRSRGSPAIGLSGQMHGATFLDAADKPLRPAILWNDGRSFAECAELERRVPDFLAAPAIWPCPASPRRRRCGSPSTSPRYSAPRRASCCRRTTCGCG